MVLMMHCSCNLMIQTHFLFDRYLVLDLLLHEALDGWSVLAVAQLLQRGGLDGLLVDPVRLRRGVLAALCPGQLTVDDAELLDLLEGAVDG